MTVLLGRADLESLLDVDECLDALRSGFLSEPSSVAAQRFRTDLPGPANGGSLAGTGACSGGHGGGAPVGTGACTGGHGGGAPVGTATALMPGLLDGVPAYTVKVNAKFPSSVPALRGLVCLHDLESGELLAVLDSATITAWRTGLAAALGTHLLSSPEARSVGVIGAGAQASLVLRGLSRVRPISAILSYDITPARAPLIGDVLSEQGSAPPNLEVLSSPSEVAARADIVVLATWAREPLLTKEDLRPGMHITSLGADEPGKVELSADLLLAGKVVVDDVDLAATSGALGNVGLSGDQALATLGDVIRKRCVVRGNSEDCTVYAPIGLPWQDLSLSWLAYQAAQRRGVGTTYDWLS